MCEGIERKSAEVISIADGTVMLSEKGINEEAIEVVEWAKGLAASGEIVGVAIIVAYADGSHGHRYRGIINSVGTIETLTKLATTFSIE